MGQARCVSAFSGLQMRMLKDTERKIIEDLPIVSVNVDHFGRTQPLEPQTGAGAPA